jgi:predicted outer membrane repeat protein
MNKLLIAAGMALGLVGSDVLVAQTVRVPQDARTLEAAISRVADGGVIELAAGTYAPSGGTITISNTRKGFTVRAAAGAQVVLSGGGTKSILRYVNSDRGRGKRVTFERLIFRNGFSTAAGVSGAATLSEAEAVFRGCTFEANHNGGLLADGGAVRVVAGSEATFIDTSFRGNSSLLRGGALVVFGATATVQGGSFTDNRTNEPGHRADSLGGAIYVLDGVLRVSGARFERNGTGFAGGAIFAFGTWDGPGTDVLVTGSTFLSNQTLADACCVNPQPTAGGAIHVEDKTRLRLHQSLLRDNRADFGGGISGFRAIVEIYASVFQENRSADSNPGRGVGGAVNVLSNDGNDSSTGGGAINRRSAELRVDRSLFQGTAGSVPTLPFVGGCVFAEGDSNRLYGENGVPQIGTVNENRARVEISGSVFSDCDVATSAGGTGVAGGLLADLADLTLTGSLFLDSDARGAGARGGGAVVEGESAAVISRTTFARNSAEDSGGGLFVGGSAVDVSDSRFYANAIRPDGGGGSLRGAAIFAIPRLNATKPKNVEGSVRGSGFFANNGVPVWDLDPASGPINDLRYDGNRFDSGFGGQVYVNTLAAPGGLSVSGLNALTVFRSGRPPTDKSDGTNQSTFAPREGAAVDVPAASAVGASPLNSTTSTLAYATVGGNASLGTFPLASPIGMIDLGPGDYPLNVGGVTVATARLTGSCTGGPFLCLNGNRFRAEVAFNLGTETRSARAVSLTADTGNFWFVDPSNVELAVKVLDGRSLNRHFWVFYGALTNLEYTLSITDRVTGTVKSYHNPSGNFASAGDTAAFPAAPAASAAASPAVADSAQSSLLSAEGFALEAASSEEPIFAPAGNCQPGPQSLCLNQGRFKVELAWRDFANHRGAGQAVPLTGDTGYFYFTAATNLEVFIKVLDGRPVNGFFWVFFGALSNQEYTITVTDTMTGAVRTYTNPLGKFGSRGDTQALPG